MPRQLLSVRWIMTTLLVIAAVGVMARLGVWQLERLAQRRAFNARVNAQLAATPLELEDHLAEPALTEMEYRSVQVSGQYDFTQQVALRNQVVNGAPGFHLLTPLIIDDGQPAVLVDRGWIPLEDADPRQWRKYDEPGRVTVRGVLRNSRPKLGIAGLADPALEPGQTRLAVWNFLDLERINGQLGRPALPVYVQQLPEASRQDLPVRSELELDLSEGSHESYAIQWFAFAATLAIGYPFFVARQIRPQRHAAVDSEYEVQSEREK